MFDESRKLPLNKHFFSICRGKALHKRTRMFLKEKKQKPKTKTVGHKGAKSKSETQFHKQLETDR